MLCKSGCDTQTREPICHAEIVGSMHTSRESQEPTKQSCLIPTPSGFHLVSPSAATVEKSIGSIRVKSIAKGGVTIPFPYKLHIMLDRMEAHAAEGCLLGKSIVGWQPHGRAFKVHKKKEFVATIMPLFFKQTKYASFQRQLNLYGFKRITARGPDNGAVWHNCFVRNQTHLVQNMVRRKINGTKVRHSVQPDDQPDFYANAHLRVIAAVDEAFADVAVSIDVNSGHDQEDLPSESPSQLQSVLGLGAECHPYRV